MREIEFRGKRIASGEWVYGSLINYSQYMMYIVVDLLKNETYSVLSDTVGQYTGLKDKKGKEIYEGDILSDGDLTTTVFWRFGEARFSNGITSWEELLPCIEVIGSIHDKEETK